MIGKVIDELAHLETSQFNEIFNDHAAIQNVLKVFIDLQATTEENMRREIETNPILLDRLNLQSAKGMLQEEQNQTLTELLDSEIISHKLYISLKKELNSPL